MIIRQPTDDDWPAMRAFIARNFGFSHLARRDFNEHWFKPPGHPGWAALALADESGSLAGLMMFIVSNVWVEGQVSRLAFISSTVIDPTARGGSGGTLLFLRGFSAFPLIGTMSGNKNSSPINARLGQPVSCGMRRFLRLHTPAVATLCRPEDQARVPDLIAGQPPAGRGDGLEPTWRDTPPDDYDSLWSVFRQRFALTTDRNMAHLHRRYVEAPILHYRFLELRRGRRLVAHAVLRAQPTPAGTVHRITDFAALPGEEAAGFAATLAASAATGAVACDFMVIGTGLDRDLRAAGFTEDQPDSAIAVVPSLLSPVDHRRWSNDCFLGGPLARETTGWHDYERVLFTKGDSDRDWPTGYDLDRLGLER